MNGKSLLGMLAAASAVLALSACGSSAAPGESTATTPAAPASSAPSPVHNAADVTFVQGMIPHHFQAVAMAKQATGQAGSEQVKQLAARIEQAQGPEIAQMRGYPDGADRAEHWAEP